MGAWHAGVGVPMASKKLSPHWKVAKEPFEPKIGMRLIRLPNSLAQWGFHTRPSGDYEPSTPWDPEVVVYVVTQIEVTGNGTKMVHLTEENNPRSKLTNWWIEFKRLMTPQPRKPKPRVKVVKPKPVPRSRFDRELD